MEFDYVIPSVYLKSMSDLYADMKYEDVVRLGQRVLMNTENIDGGIIYETRYLMCSALAKLKKASFWMKFKNWNTMINYSLRLLLQTSWKGGQGA